MAAMSRVDPVLADPVPRVEAVPRVAPPLPSLCGPALWRSDRGRALLWQLAGGLGIGLALIVLGRLAYANFLRQNVPFSFGFLAQPAGIDIAESLLPFSPNDSIGWLILTGGINTFHVCLVVAVLATVIGLLVGILRLAANPLVRFLTGSYVHVIRNTPLLLQILFWYALLLQLPPIRSAWSLADLVFVSQRGLQLPGFLIDWNRVFLGASLPIAAAAGLVSWFTLSGRVPDSVRRLTAVLASFAVLIALAGWGGAIAVDIPERKGFNFRGGLTLSPEFTALVISQALYAGAFIGELVRAGIESVPAGQREAGRALGLSQARILRLIVLPQALVAIIPPATSQYVGIIKNSSLAIAIGFPDLFWALLMAITISGQSVAGVVLILVTYLLPAAIAAALLDRFNSRMLARNRP
ncbi:ABC transporter permease subunit [Sinirhodobacter populi]|uniref:ABC transporter permease subunit n=1 Tax=Paenirhodobacter populi TaxID=2306993 RepID=A0A443K4I9_9RHOB|nr:ABC transporter permease subunit [Sinirhodobacter populi]RWR27679.1 ABC transporter permease subunit [Sinirhodobacter populi]